MATRSIGAGEVRAILADNVLISVYEPDQDHGWTPGAIRAMLAGDRREDGR